MSFAAVTAATWRPAHGSQAEARMLVRGCPGIISFGVAGGLAPHLRPGTCVVGSAVISGSSRMPISREWSQKLLQTIPDSVSGALLGVPAPIADPDQKRALYLKTGAIAVDMESHIVAAVGLAHEVPVAAIRVITDPAKRALPVSAVAAMRRTEPPILAPCSAGVEPAARLARSFSDGARRPRRAGDAGPRQAFARTRLCFAADDLRRLSHVQVRRTRNKPMGGSVPPLG